MGRITYTANGVFPGHKLRGKERYAKLYHYTSFDSFVKIWLSKSLKFSNVKNMNDVLESTLNPSTSQFWQAPLAYAYLDIRPRFRQISLTMDYDSYMKGCMSPVMWGTYADKKNGVCIELDYDKIKFPKDVIKGPVVYKEFVDIYKEIPSEVQTINQLKQFIVKNKKKEFLTKQMSWKGENEYRILKFDGDYLDITGAISAVHVVSYNSDECLFVEKLVNNEVPVKYLHYVSNNNRALPVMTDTQSSRKEMENAKNIPQNALVKLTEKARAIYDSHKADPDFPLVLTSL